MLVLHASDLQVGRPYRPTVAEAFIRLARERAFDVVVLSGDLTQRAKVQEYRTVRRLLEELSPTPVVVTPGNHDVPLYRVWERLLSPYRNWRTFVAEALDTVTTVPGGTLVALNSSAPRRAIVAGRIRPGQVRWAAQAFARAPKENARILVIHHHFVPTPDHQGGSPLPGARRLLEAFEAMDVDLVLGGHVHQTHISTSRALVAGQDAGIPLVACGTTTSSRGRGPEAGANSLNVVGIEGGEVSITPHRFDPEAGEFRPRESAARAFPRRAQHTPSGTGGPA